MEGFEIGSSGTPTPTNPLSVLKKQKNTARVFFIFWRRARDFSEAAASIASLRSLARRRKQSTGLFSSATSLLPPCSNPLSTLKKQKNTARVFFVFWRRARDSNPRTGYSPLHDFQSCSFGQLGQLSVFCLIIIQYKNINCKSKYYVL